MIGFFALSALCLTQAAPKADEVFHLPGWNHKLFSRTYAGYIDVGSKAPNATKMYEHYLYFESEGDPTTDPLIMWTNGGPGASSFFGAFSELGPYALSDASLQTDDYKKTGVPTLFENPFRWTKLGNLLIRNLPPPIGFSYCDPAGPAGDGYSCGPWNDTSVAEHSYDFMNNFVTNAFPELQKNDLFLTGESYAGVYIPMLAQQITDLHPPNNVLNKMLKGIAVGDGCVSGVGCVPNSGPYFSIEFYHGHGQISTKTYDRIHSVCTKKELLDGGDVNSKCKMALDQMDKEKGYNFGYNLYDECYDFSLDDGLSAAPLWHEAPKIGGPAVHGLEARRKKKAELRQQDKQDKQDSTANKRSLTSMVGQSIDSPDAWHMDGSPCGGTDVLPDWAGHPLVKKALHVAPNAKFFTGDNGVGFTYNGTAKLEDILGYYKELVQRNTEGPNKAPRLLMYNGDADPGLNSFVGEAWTTGMGFKETEAWRPWTRDGKTKMGGYVTRYEGQFDYLTIRGSGHMVPEYKPEAATVFLESFLKNKPYPSLNMPGN